VLHRHPVLYFISSALQKQTANKTRWHNDEATEGRAAIYRVDQTKGATFFVIILANVDWFS